MAAVMVLSLIVVLLIIHKFGVQLGKQFDSKMQTVTSLFRRIIRWIVTKYFRIIDVNNNHNRKSRVRRSSRNYYKRISHPFIEGKSITRRSIFPHQKKTCINMKDFRCTKNDIGSDLYFDDEYNKFSQQIFHFIITVIILFFSFVVFPRKLIGIMSNIGFVLFVSFAMISSISGNLCLISGGDITLSIVSGDTSALINVSSKCSTFDVYSVIIGVMEIGDPSGFYLSFEDKPICIKKSVALQHYNIYPRMAPYQLYVAKVGLYGGGKRKTSTKSLDEYLKKGSLLIYETATEEGQCDSYNLGEIVSFDQFKLSLCKSNLQRFHTENNLQLQILFTFLHLKNTKLTVCLFAIIII